MSQLSLFVYSLAQFLRFVCCCTPLDLPVLCLSCLCLCIAQLSFYVLYVVVHLQIFQYYVLAVFVYVQLSLVFTFCMLLYTFKSSSIMSYLSLFVYSLAQFLRFVCCCTPLDLPVLCLSCLCLCIAQLSFYVLYVVVHLQIFQYYVLAVFVYVQLSLVFTFCMLLYTFRSSSIMSQLSLFVYSLAQFLRFVCCCTPLDLPVLCLSCLCLCIAQLSFYVLYVVVHLQIFQYYVLAVFVYVQLSLVFTFCMLLYTFRSSSIMSQLSLFVYSLAQFLRFVCCCTPLDLPVLCLSCLCLCIAQLSFYVLYVVVHLQIFQYYVLAVFVCVQLSLVFTFCMLLYTFRSSSIMSQLSLFMYSLAQFLRLYVVVHLQIFQYYVLAVFVCVQLSLVFTFCMLLYTFRSSSIMSQLSLFVYSLAQFLRFVCCCTPLDLPVLCLSCLCLCIAQLSCLRFVCCCMLLYTFRSSSIMSQLSLFVYSLAQFLRFVCCCTPLDLPVLCLSNVFVLCTPLAQLSFYVLYVVVHLQIFQYYVLAVVLYVVVHLQIFQYYVLCNISFCMLLHTFRSSSIMFWCNISFCMLLYTFRSSSIIFDVIYRFVCCCIQIFQYYVVVYVLYVVVHLQIFQYYVLAVFVYTCIAQLSFYVLYVVVHLQIFQYYVLAVFVCVQLSLVFVRFVCCCTPLDLPVLCLDVMLLLYTFRSSSIMFWCNISFQLLYTFRSSAQFWCNISFFVRFVCCCTPLDLPVLCLTPLDLLCFDVIYRLFCVQLSLVFTFCMLLYTFRSSSIMSQLSLFVYSLAQFLRFVCCCTPLDLPVLCLSCL